MTGNLALFTDIADLLATRLWLVIGFVVLISVVLLTMMFRSIAVPVKAAAMNLLQRRGGVRRADRGFLVGLGSSAARDRLTRGRCRRGYPS